MSSLVSAGLRLDLASFLPFANIPGDR